MIAPYHLAKLGQLLRKMRKEKGWRLEDVADQEISPATISNIERGLPNVSMDKIVYLAKKLGHTIPELLKQDREAEENTRLKLRSIENEIDLIDPDEGFQELKRLDKKTAEAYAHVIGYLKGKCLNKKGQWKKAESCFFDAIKVIDQRPDLEKSNIKSACFNELGVIYYYKLNLEKALYYTQEGIDCYIDDGERKYYKCTLLTNKALYLEQLGLLEEALHTIEQVAAKKDDFISPHSILNLYHICTKIYRKMGMFDKAIQYAIEGIEKARLSKMYDQSFRLWLALGNIYLDKNELDRAESCYLMALKLRKKATKERLSISACIQLGLLYVKQRKWQLAETNLQEAIKGSEKMNDMLKYTQAVTILGDSFLERGMWSEATQLFEKAFVVIQKDGLKIEDQEQLFLKLVYSYRFLGRQEEIQKWLDQLFAIKFDNGLGDKT